MIFKNLYNQKKKLKAKKKKKDQGKYGCSVPWLMFVDVEIIN